MNPLVALCIVAGAAVGSVGVVIAVAHCRRRRGQGKRTPGAAGTELTDRSDADRSAEERRAPDALARLGRSVASGVARVTGRVHGRGKDVGATDDDDDPAAAAAPRAKSSRRADAWTAPPGAALEKESE